MNHNKEPITEPVGKIKLRKVTDRQQERERERESVRAPNHPEGRIHGLGSPGGAIIGVILPFRGCSY